MRAKFKVDVVKNYNSGSDWQEVELSAVYSDKSGEDNQFSQATPNGKITMTISNPAALGFLKAGQKYFIDFTEAGK